MNRPDPRLAELISDCSARVEHALDHFLPDTHTHPGPLHEAMRYAVMGGGKRLRPLLVYATGQGVGADTRVLDRPACAVEMIHAYSLVHDDLPSMDDDDLRRGRPTCHNAYGEAMAILAGDALQALAFHTIANDHPSDLLPASIRLRMITILGSAAGSRGMAGGQAIDLMSVGHSLDGAELENMHIHKTGALIRASVSLGALCNPDIHPATLERLDHFAKCIGLAFQIWDDVLDETGDVARMGKRTGVDRARDKPTYPSLLGLKGASQRAKELSEEAIATIQGLGDGKSPLAWIANYIVSREN